MSIEDSVPRLRTADEDEPHALRAAEVDVKESDHLQLSERDSLRVLDLLENPPAPNAKLLGAARALPKWL